MPPSLNIRCTFFANDLGYIPCVIVKIEVVWLVWLCELTMQSYQKKNSWTGLSYNKNKCVVSQGDYSEKNNRLMIKDMKRLYKMSLCHFIIVIHIFSSLPLWKWEGWKTFEIVTLWSQILFSDLAAVLNNNN